MRRRVPATSATPRARRTRAAGFTLLEVMIALLLATIGLLGTVAVQQTMFNATANANDAAIATRLATQALEEFSARTVRIGLDQLATEVSPDWTDVKYLNAAGGRNPTKTPEFRFKRETWVVDQGATNPYAVSVRVTYDLDNGSAKTIRVDQQRRKTW
ncbi:MAG TPA: prepilin-type N-terminal cleavage/methylation domain-containing protein [Polyangia bacterium]|jgi:type IV pilus modification protein PilV|nr:prepilin-type N-terminal cleavage/methylation domain-containing protein [Polyangia bacterium]